MAYTKTTWVDTIGTIRNNVKDEAGTIVHEGVSIEYNASKSDIVQVGTEFSSSNLNNIENGIEANDILATENSNVKDQRNYFINPNFDIWQRGTSFAIGVTDLTKQYLADRWAIQRNSIGDDTLNISRSTIVPANGKSKYSLKINTYGGSIFQFSQAISSNSVKKSLSDSIKTQILFKLDVPASESVTINYNVYYPSAEDDYATRDVAYVSGFGSISDTNSFIELLQLDDLPLTSINNGYSIANGIQVVYEIQTISSVEHNLYFAQAEFKHETLSSPFIPPNPDEELEKCKVYANFNDGSSFVSHSAYRVEPNLIVITVPLTKKMRVPPTFIGAETTNWNIKTKAYVNTTGWTINPPEANNNSIALVAIKTAHGLSHPFIEMRAGTGFDAEIY